MHKFLFALCSIFLISFNVSAYTYKIAVDAAYPPFSFKKGDTFVGIELDMLEEIAKREGFSYELKFMNFDGVIPGLVSGQIDGALDGINISEERKKIVDFSDGYFKSGLCVVTRANDDRIKQFTDLEGKTAAIKKGTYGMEFAEKHKQTLDLHLQYYLLSPDLALAVRNNNADFFMEDYPVISYQIKIGEQQGLKIALRDIYGSPVYAFAVKKGENQELLNMFNRGLKSIQEDGTFNKILKRYIE